jgi:DeoR family fructose operon transcriptional repressor
VRQVHGGISALTTVAGPIDFRLRAVEGQEVKRLIAQRAIGLLDSGSVIALDAGTTTLEVARNLPEDMRLTVVTHSLPAMGALASRAAVEVIGLGGQLHSDTQAFAGSITVQMIRDLRVSTALLAATAIRDGAMWCTNTFDAETKQALIRSADRVILLADSSKLEATAVMRVTGLESVDMLITDDEVDPKVARSIKQLGVELIIVSS